MKLTLGSTRWNLRPARIARLLELPADGRRSLAIGGSGATAWFTALARRVDREPVDADWAISSKGIRVIPARSGYVLDVPRSATVLLRAALVTAPELRSAKPTVERADADRTTEDAKGMSITGLVASYQTFYGGDPNRIHNVQLVSHLVDKHLIAPGATFSFNAATGERSADKGFLEAPVIINGELQNGLGGGVCQVSTTVFNAAYEAGLPIVERTNHALYISHYPQGRDATVNYPDVDLKFVNDTGHWLLLRTWVGSSSLTVAIYGTPVHRRVVSETAPLVVTGPAPVKRVPDPTLLKGQKVVEESGEPARSTSVQRKVYDRGRQAPLRRHLLLVLSRRGVPRPRRHEAEAGNDDRDDDDHRDDDDPEEAAEAADYDGASALATASASAGGSGSDAGSTRRRTRARSSPPRELLAPLTE